MLPNYEQLQKLMDERKITPYRIGKETSVKAQTLSAWKNGEYSPKADKIEVLAAYFNVPTSYFYESDIPSRVVVDYSQEYWDQKEPVFDVAAGQGRINDGKPSEYIDDAFPDEESCLVRIYGDSMFPVLHDGDVVKIEKTSDKPDPRKLTAVQINGDEATIKYVTMEADGIWLRAENKDVFEDIFYTWQDVMTLPIQIVGVAKGIVWREL